MAEFKEVVSKRNEICKTHTTCVDCPLRDLSCNTFHNSSYGIEKFEEVVMGWDVTIDWSKVEVDTKILVRNNEDCNWERRYFAKYENGRVYAYDSGQTSWSATTSFSWDFAKLWRGDNK